MNECAPIAVTVYNRINTFKVCIAALRENPLATLSDLYVISDASSHPKDDKLIDEIRDFSRGISGFKQVHLIFWEKNIGGFESVVQAEKMILDKHGKIIILEDDVIASKSFLSFLNGGLTNLKENKSIFSISSYCPPPAYTEKLKNKMLIAPLHCPWGYATWKDRYQSVNTRHNPYLAVLNDKSVVSYITRHAPFMLEALRGDYINDTGCADVRISFQMLLKGMKSAYPAVSLSRNIGLDGSGQKMGINYGLMKQSVCDDYEVTSWDLVDDQSFQTKLVRNGAEGNRQLMLAMLYRLGLRDSLDPLVTAARRIKKKIYL
jgi:hypothetical protein